MLGPDLFPRWVFKAGAPNRLTMTPKEHAQALKDGWFDTVLEAEGAEPVAPAPPAPDYKAPDAPDDGPLPTRAELEAKAEELGIKYNPQLGDKRLAALIQEKLEA